MLLFGVCFVLYFIKLSAGKGFYSSLDRVESLMFQNLLEPASNNTTR